MNSIGFGNQWTW